VYRVCRHLFEVGVRSDSAHPLVVGTVDLTIEGSPFAGSELMVWIHTSHDEGSDQGAHLWSSTTWTIWCKWLDSILLLTLAVG